MCSRFFRRSSTLDLRRVICSPGTSIGREEASEREKGGSMMRKRGSIGRYTALLSQLAAGAIVAAGCAGQEQPPAQAAAPASPEPAAVQAPSPAPAEAAADQKATDADLAKQAMVLKDVGFAAPESVLYDAEQDVYFISNVNGDPLAKDGNGFISKVGPDGKVIDLKWIDGSKAKTTLDAPKGMGISGNFLYVADITRLRLFDRKSGAPRGELFVKGATFLNDIAVAKDGTVYVSDTGWKTGKEGFEKNGSDGVFKVDPKVVAPKPVVQSTELGNPNGLAVNTEGVWAVSAEGKLYRVTAAGKREQESALPSKGLDGVVALDDGTFLVSSWESSTVYQGKPGGEFKALAKGIKSPADIGFDAKRGRLLVPQMTENTVAIYDMPGNAELLAKAESPAKEGDAAPGEKKADAQPSAKPAMKPASGAANKETAASAKAAEPKPAAAKATEPKPAAAAKAAEPKAAEPKAAEPKAAAPKAAIPPQPAAAK